MTVRECPKCGLVSSPTARNCDCGFNFETYRQERPPGRKNYDSRYREGHISGLQQALRFDSYDHVPFFRKRWFMGFCLILFTPMALIIALTGDIYMLRNGRIYRYDEKRKRGIITACVFFIVIALLKIASYLDRPFY